MWSSDLAFIPWVDPSSQEASSPGPTCSAQLDHLSAVLGLNHCYPAEVGSREAGVGDRGFGIKPSGS